MNHTFDTVDEKIAEAEFFLQKIAAAGMDLFAVKCYLSAYLSASRTATLALQQFKHIPGFDVWYKEHQERLRADPLSKYFLDLRNAHVHGGPYPVAGGSFSKEKTEYWFPDSKDAPVAPPSDSLTGCREHFVKLLEIIYDCYVELGVYVDPQQYYTKEHFASMGKGIDDAEIDVWGWVCSSSIEDGHDEDDRWHELRSHVSECKINYLFYSYLGQPTPQPILPDHYIDFAFGPEDRGWVHAPAGFESMEEYHRHVGIDIDEWDWFRGQDGQSEDLSD